MTFVKKTDWDGIADFSRAQSLFFDLRGDGLVGMSQAERLRFWTAREYALANGENPPAYFQWLLKNRDALMPMWAEDKAVRLLSKPQLPKEDTHTTPIGEIVRGLWVQS